jgi:Flp pilus assembly protein TadD
MKRRLQTLTIAAALATAALCGCARSGSDASGTRAADSATDSASRLRSQAFIEAANQAYQAGDYELALKRYAAAAVADPHDPAAYFGMGMTFSRLKREDESRAAYARARRLAAEAAQR